MSIAAEDISFEVDGKFILKDVHLEILPGEVLSIIGPNGAGKSTLLNIISGDLKPTEGQIFYQNENIRNVDIQERAFLRGVMSQSQQIVFDFSVREIIEMGWLDRGLSSYAEDFEKAVSLIADECKLENLLERKFNVLSGGEQRRVHYARTLLQLWRPSNSQEEKFMFLDEPTANLDLYFEIQLMKSIKNKAMNAYGVLLIVHDLNLAAKFSDKILLLDAGRVKAFGTPKEVLVPKMLSSVYGIEMQVDHNSLKISYY